MKQDLRGFWKDGSAPAARKKKRKNLGKYVNGQRKFKRREQAALNKAGVTAPGAKHPDYRADDKFYKSAVWRTLRYAALKNSDGRCGCCGASAGHGVQLHVDHIIPRYKGPSLALDIENLQVLCDDCNIGKGAWDDTNWREHFRSI